MEEKLQDIGVKINILESLSRILLATIREGENLKPFDSENLALVVYKNVLDVKKEFNEIETDVVL